MTPRQESLLTLALVALCALIALAGLLPRLTVRFGEVRAVRPDITVSVAGEVLEPGVYTLPWGARVGDLVEAAGGFSASAETSLVAPADPLTAGEAVFVPGRRSPDGGSLVSLNSASEAELDTLPGVGPTTAARIVAGRPYGRLDDLLRVRGVGPKTLERLRPLVRL